MGVCCVVFDIDGMLFEFVMNFLNIEKKKKKMFFQYFILSNQDTCLIRTVQGRHWTVLIRQVVLYIQYIYPFRKTNFFHWMFSSCFFYARSISNIFRFFLGNIEKCPFTYWLYGRWFLQIVDIGNFNMKLNGRCFPQIVDHVDRDSGNLYPIHI